MTPTAGISGCHRLWSMGSCSQAFFLGSMRVMGRGVFGGIGAPAPLRTLRKQYQVVAVNMGLQWHTQHQQDNSLNNTVHNRLGFALPVSASRAAGPSTMLAHNMPSESSL